MCVLPAAATSAGASVSASALGAALVAFSVVSSSSCRVNSGGACSLHRAVA
jgi:hypothetical protein